MSPVAGLYHIEDVMKLYQVDRRVVLRWILSGELDAFDVSREAGSRKRHWRIRAEALTRFEEKRAGKKRVPTRPKAVHRTPEIIEMLKNAPKIFRT